MSGAGNPKQIYDVIRHTKVSGVGLASMLHYDAIKFLPKLKLKLKYNFLESVKKD